jgi:hypothetical protein
MEYPPAAGQVRRIRLNPPWILNRGGMLDGIVDMPELAGARRWWRPA